MGKSKHECLLCCEYLWCLTDRHGNNSGKQLQLYTGPWVSLPGFSKSRVLCDWWGIYSFLPPGLDLSQHYSVYTYSLVVLYTLLADQRSFVWRFTHVSTVLFVCVFILEFKANKVTSQQGHCHRLTEISTTQFGAVCCWLLFVLFSINNSTTLLAVSSWLLFVLFRKAFAERSCSRNSSERFSSHHQFSCLMHFKTQCL